MKHSGSTWLSRTIIESPLCIGLCINEAQFRHEMKRLKIPREDWPDWIPEDSDAVVHLFEAQTDHKKCAIVCIGTHEDPNVTVGLLVHESVHIWQRICDALDEKNPSREFEAYAIQTISVRLIAAYSELSAKQEKDKQSSADSKA